MSAMRDSGPDDPRRARAGRATAAELRTYLTVASLLLAGAAIISVIRSAARKGTGPAGVALGFLATGLVLLSIHGAILGGAWTH